MVGTNWGVSVFSKNLFIGPITVGGRVVCSLVGYVDIADSREVD